MNNFNYEKIWESQIVDEIESYKKYESIISAEDNLSERKVRKNFLKFLKDGGMIA